MSIQKPIHATLDSYAIKIGSSFCVRHQRTFTTSCSDCDYEQEKINFSQSQSYVKEEEGNIIDLTGPEIQVIHNALHYLKNNTGNPKIYKACFDIQKKLE